MSIFGEDRTALTRHEGNVNTPALYHHHCHSPEMSLYDIGYFHKCWNKSYSATDRFFDGARFLHNAHKKCFAGTKIANKFRIEIQNLQSRLNGTSIRKFCAKIPCMKACAPSNVKFSCRTRPACSLAYT